MKLLLTGALNRQNSGSWVVKTKKGKRPKLMVVPDGQGFPLGSILTSAWPAEVRRALQTLDAVNVPRAGRARPKKRPKRLIADKGYDSDPLRQRLKN